MRLGIKRFNVSTGGPLVAVMNSADAAELDLHPQDRIRVKRLRSGESLTLVADVGPRGVRPGEIALFEEAFEDLGVPEGTHVDVELAKLPDSLGYIHAKLDGAELVQAQIREIVQDVVGNRISAIELTYFVSGCYAKGLNLREAAYLTNAIVETGERLRFNNNVVLDKHAVGGVPGNRTTMVITPIIAAAGFKIPKTSSRAITSAAGTADTMEVLAPVALSRDRIEKIVRKTNGCMVWGGTMHLAGADERMIMVRHPLSIDPPGMMLASILAKKKAVGATHVLIDIPYGAHAKLATRREAKKLKRSFEKLGKLVGLKVNAILTDGSQPVGNGIGPALECRDVLSVLHGNGPSDLMEKCVFMASEMLKMVGVKDARKRVMEILQSGKALEKFREIVSAQGGRKNLKVPQARLFHAVAAGRSGTVRLLHNKELVKVARAAGSPADKTAGIYLHVKVGHKVGVGDNLFFIHAHNKDKLDNAIQLLETLNPVIIK